MDNYVNATTLMLMYNRWMLYSMSWHGLWMKS